MSLSTDTSITISSVVLAFCLVGLCCLPASNASARQKSVVDVASIDRVRILKSAEECLKEPPVTVTAFSSPRSTGGVHEYFSEGDYWWPDPKNPDGPYVQRDGMTNPDNFNKHREVMRRFCDVVSALTAAYKITGDEKFASKAILHLHAWCVDDATKMYPHLKYAQAIKGKFTGRGTGIIDTIHLIEAARAVEVLSGSKSFKAGEEAAIKQWFGEYLQWLTTHQYGIDEREAKNNHGTWWVTQAAAFAHLVNDTATLSSCRSRFKNVFLPKQFAADGSFPEELRRTKPYSYSIFNLEGMAAICWVLSTADDNLWEFTLPDGRNMRKAVQFLYPYIVDKSKWPYAKDVMHFDAFPARQPFLLFAGIALGEQRYVETWKTLDADSGNEEVRRSIPIRQPVLWVR
ncbi:MAG: alginate lyase family protein [Ignavibacteriales bacterium]|nr:alginate lyase family protein [Ignavibacteriales bacterium]